MILWCGKKANILEPQRSGHCVQSRGQGAGEQVMTQHMGHLSKRKGTLLKCATQDSEGSAMHADVSPQPS